MTKKNYIIIAEALKNYQYYLEQNKRLWEKDYETLIDFISHKLSEDNPKFNQYIFEKACGIINN